MKIVHVIAGLQQGGAEAVLYRLCKHGTADEHHVVSLTGCGKYGPMLEEIGVRVTPLDFTSVKSSMVSFWRLIRMLRRERPEVVQTWMYHADLVGGIAAFVSGIRNIVWGIRSTELAHEYSSKRKMWIRSLCSRLSYYLPRKIIVCAQVSIHRHADIGYDVSKMTFVPNGYDVNEFTTGLDADGSFKRKLSSRSDLTLVGAVGRFDPVKDHTTMLEALALVRSQGIPFRCVLVGSGLEVSNDALVQQIEQRGLSEHIRLLGPMSDIPLVMNALDVHLLSSSSEAFPNVVAEAMACGTPCVVTDVGDAATIVGDTGWVVPSKDPVALAQAIRTAISEVTDGWTVPDRGTVVRDRIVDKYSIERMVEGYRDVWRNGNG